MTEQMKKTVRLDARALQEAEQAHAYLQRILGFPDYYGRNLDALHDCLTQLGPVRLEIEHAPGEGSSFYRRLCRVLDEARREEEGLELCFEETPGICTLRPVAFMENDLEEKFGIPRQSGLVPELTGRIVLEPEFRNDQVLRGLEGFDRIWLIWQFSGNVSEGWSPTVRPPRLGGNVHRGVFATRSPFRPNPLGLSCVKLEGIDREDARGPVLCVSGADLMNGTPIYDIKPYVAYSDAYPEAAGGFTDSVEERKLRVIFPGELLARIPAEKQRALIGMLEQDPRPSYQRDAQRVYGMRFAGYEIHFRTDGQVLTVCAVDRQETAGA